MFCPECQKEEKKSMVYVGASTTTLLGFTPYYDEDGVYQHNDPNITTTNYSCSGGHTWTERKRGGEII